MQSVAPSRMWNEVSAGNRPRSPIAMQTKAGQKKAPDYTDDIAPILYQNCAPCHRPGESGPFSLLTYQDAKRHARQIAAVTRSRYMPRWLPQPGYGDFAGQRRLTDAQIQTISDWVNTNAPEGPAPEPPAPPHFTNGWQLGPPDLILEASHPLLLSASGPDVFWNFIYRPKIDTTRYVRAIEIRPGDKRIVHHATSNRRSHAFCRKARTRRSRISRYGFGYSKLCVRSRWSLPILEARHRAGHRAGRFRLASRSRQRPRAQHSLTTYG